MEAKYLKYLQINSRIEDVRDRKKYHIQAIKDNSVLAVDLDRNAKELAAEHIRSMERVRFVAPSGRTLFAVQNFGQVKVGGDVFTVIWMDDCHFRFDVSGVRGAVWQIDEYAANQNRRCSAVQNLDAMA